MRSILEAALRRELIEIGQLNGAMDPDLTEHPPSNAVGSAKSTFLDPSPDPSRSCRLCYRQPYQGLKMNSGGSVGGILKVRPIARWQLVSPQS